MSRVLMFPFAPGSAIAHTGACLSIGEELAARGHEVTLAYGGSRPDVAAGSPVRVVPVDEVPEVATGRAAPGIYRDADDLARHARADAELIEGEAPDAVLVDLRMAAQLACELIDAPGVALVHFLPLLGYSADPRWRRRARELRRPLTALSHLPRLLGHDPLRSDRLVANVRAARRRLGLAVDTPLIHARRVAITSAPELDPANGLPGYWRYVGPITWRGPGRAAAAPTAGAQPLVYVTQGSAGSAKALRAAVRELAGEPVDVLAAATRLCPADELAALGPNVRAEPDLPGAECMRAADVAVIHGGHLTACEAHLAGKPVVVVPAGLDHWITVHRVRRLRVGVALPPPRAPGEIRRAVRRLLRDDHIRRRAQALAERLGPWDGRARAADLVEELT